MTVKLLTRHFIDAMLAPEVLTEAGADYLRRTLFGILAVLLVLGIFITRAFFDKYTKIGALVGSDAYRLAVQADSLLMIAVPMVLIGLATVIAGPLLFPDETDYRVLTPLPITRAQLFISKLCAVAIIVAAAIFAVNAVTTFWFPVSVGGRKAQHPLVMRVVAHAIASFAGSVFMFVAVMAVQGLTIVATPRPWQRRISVAVQGVMFVGLLLSAPLLTRMPSMGVTADTVTTSPLTWMPPVWFLGVERWLLDGAGAGGYINVAQVAALAIALSMSIVLLSYVALYRSAERLARMAGDDRGQRPPRS